jgi:hypothetical protein
MPVIINRTPVPPRRVPPRTKHFNAAVTRLAPSIAEARKAGHQKVEDIMKELNDQEVAAPNGNRFTFGTMHRILERLEELGLGPGPRTVSEAVSARPSMPRASNGASFESAFRALAREHPELLEGLDEPGS